MKPTRLLFDGRRTRWAAARQAQTILADALTATILSGVALMTSEEYRRWRQATNTLMNAAVYLRSPRRYPSIQKALRRANAPYWG